MQQENIFYIFVYNHTYMYVRRTYKYYDVSIPDYHFTELFILRATLHKL